MTITEAEPTEQSSERLLTMYIPADHLVELGRLGIEIEPTNHPGLVKATFPEDFAEELGDKGQRLMPPKVIGRGLRLIFHYEDNHTEIKPSPDQP